MATQEDVDKFIYALIENQYLKQQKASYDLDRASGIEGWLAKQQVRFSTPLKQKIIELFSPFARFLQEQIEEAEKVFDPSEGREGIAQEVIARVVICEIFKGGFSDRKSYLEALKYFYIGMGSLYTMFDDLADKRYIRMVSQVAKKFIDVLESDAVWVVDDSNASSKEVHIPQVCIPFAWGRSFSNQLKIKIPTSTKDKNAALSQLEADINRIDFAIGSSNFAIRRPDVLIYAIRAMLTEVKDKEFLDVILGESGCMHSKPIEKKLAEDFSKHPEKFPPFVSSWFVFWLDAKGVVQENILPILYYTSQALLAQVTLEMAKNLFDYFYMFDRPQISVVDTPEEIIITGRNRLALKSMHESRASFGSYIYIGEGNATTTLKISKHKPIAPNELLEATINWNVQVFSKWRAHPHLSTSGSERGGERNW